MTITIKKMTSPQEIDLFWQKKREYEQKDIYPNMELEPDETLEEVKGFFESQEYYDIIMDRHKNSGMQFAFFYKDEEYLGFTCYIIYTKEDGKAVVLDFCIDEPFRNHGLGAKTYAVLAKTLKEEGGTYAALNTSNSNNRRFWENLGFQERGVDEWGEQFFVKKID